MSKLNIAILMGGPSQEYEVSLKTGKMILNALDKEKYNVTPVVIGKDGKWLLPQQENPLPGGRVLEDMKSGGLDLAFIAMHGTYGEDGTIQGFLEAANVPYTGSGILASALAMDKIKSSEIFSFHKIEIPDFLSFSFKDWKKDAEKILADVQEHIGFPCIIKPACCGSSFGISLVKEKNYLKEAMESAFSCSEKILAQKFIVGHEVTCAILDEGGDTEPVALPPTQIIPKAASFFDFGAKYAVSATEEVTPPRLPKEIIKRIQEIALSAHGILGCSGMSRTDMIVTDGEIYVLETNTIPGMTETSLYPQAAKAVGIAFGELLDKIIKSGLNKK